MNGLHNLTLMAIEQHHQFWYSRAGKEHMPIIIPWLPPLCGLGTHVAGCLANQKEQGTFNISIVRLKVSGEYFDQVNG